jgi:hypothetical protein
MALVPFVFGCFSTAYSGWGSENTVYLKLKQFEKYLKPKLTVRSKLLLDWSEADLYTRILYAYNGRIPNAQ